MLSPCQKGDKIWPVEELRKKKSGQGMSVEKKIWPGFVCEKKNLASHLKRKKKFGPGLIFQAPPQ